MPELDPRIHAYRPDLAAESLKGKVQAARFTAGRAAQVRRGVSDMRRHPSQIARLTSQVIRGETVTCYDEIGDWAWVQNETDGYVGYVESSALRFEVFEDTHQVSVRHTFLFPEPDLKSPPMDSLTMTGSVQVIGESGNYSEVAGGGWVYSKHLMQIADTAPDFVETALEYLGVPYLWGGRTSLGLDCSGLVQVALNRAGIPCPRDSDMAAEALGTEVPYDRDKTEIRRGDVIYMPGHCTIALDGASVVHANAFALQVTVEALEPVLERVRVESRGRGVTAIRRIE